MNKEATKKALLEVGRIVVLAILAWLLAGGVDYLVTAFGFSGDMQLQVTAILILILKGIDKWMHEVGKETEGSVLLKGITRF